MKHFLVIASIMSVAFSAAVVTVTAPAAVVTVTAGSGAVASAVSSGNLGSSASNAVSNASDAVSNASNASNTAASGNALITEDEFMAAWKAGVQIVDPNTPVPTHDQYVAMVKNAGPAGGITSRQELAMFFAEIMHESGGLLYKKEISPPAGAYGTGAPGKQYYGRGYIQLSWPDNYSKASQALLGNNSLYDDPDQVATNEDLAWGVSFYYWKAVVKPALAPNPQAFGLATNAINGPVECHGKNTPVAQKRFNIYKAVLKVWEPSMTPIETGCYN